jgi:mannan endo-1,4-beta-mannosidase
VKQTLHVWVLVMACIGLVSCASVESRRQASGEPQTLKHMPFVTVDDARFWRHGKPYYFVGTNFWYGAYLGGTTEGRERLTKELDLLKSLGINNLRVLAASERTSLTRAVNPAFHLAPGQYNPELLTGLDVLLDEMAKRDMVVVLYLNNYWQWSGGMSQYMSWLTGEPPFDPDVTGDWNGFMQNSAEFYRSDNAQIWYQDLIRTLVTRTNTVNGRIYSDDPTIMSWQLANEPRPGSDQDGRPYFPQYKEWITKTARFIKSLDANHLVSTGSEGAMGTLRDLALYQEAHTLDEVDYLTLHLWPKNWSWFDVTRPEATFAEALVKSKSYILEHLQVARALGKPAVLEEFGIERDAADYRQGATTAQRDRFFKEILGFLENQVRLSAPIAGSNFWAWGGFGRAQSQDFIWRNGDPFTGDPPQEAQGLNSVFAGDKATLEILREHARFMNAR